MGFIMKGIGAIIGLFILLILLGAIFGSHDTSMPAATTSQPSDTKTAYTRDNVNFVNKERVEENIKAGLAKSGDYKEVQVPLNTTIVGSYAFPEDTAKQEEETTQTQAQSSRPKEETTASSTPQSVIDAAIAEKLVKYDSIKEAIVKDNVIMVSIADSSQAGKEAALRTIANVLMYGYISNNAEHATFYLIYLKEKMFDGSYYDVGKSEVNSNEIEDALEQGGSIAAKLELGDKMIGRLSKN